jgi:hypothetical protein
MHLAPAFHELDPERIWNAFPRWINARHASFEGRQFHAEQIVHGQGLQLAVTMSDGSSPVATYKCGISRVRERGSAWIVFAPLVVIWEAATPGSRFNLGRAMVDHLSSAACEFQQTHQICGETILIASGNLTEEKGGAHFFRALGWDIVTPRKRGTEVLHLDEPRFKTPFIIIEEQINKALIPLRAAGKISDEPISFAVRQLRP